jgi:hypothetical protein
LRKGRPSASKPTGMRKLLATLESTIVSAELMTICCTSDVER